MSEFEDDIYKRQLTYAIWTYLKTIKYGLHWKLEFLCYCD